MSDDRLTQRPPAHPNYDPLDREDSSEPRESPYPIHYNLSLGPMKEIFRVLALITKLGMKIPGIVADGKITAAELWDVAVTIAAEYEFDVEEDGFTVPGSTQS